MEKAILKLEKTIEFDLPVRFWLSGIEAEHSADFIIDRERDPYGTVLILIFRSEARILTLHGVEMAFPGDCMIHTPDFPQYHAAIPGTETGYRNDWLHVFPEALEEIMKDLELPYNVLIRSGDENVLSPFIRGIRQEILEADCFSGRSVLNLLEAMLLALKRAEWKNHFRTECLTRSEQRWFPSFEKIREELRNHPEMSISLRKLARRAGLSPVRFSALYRKFFGKGAYTEITEARIMLAKRLLIETTLETKEIAEKCGWTDYHYFSRIFKEKTGIPPSHFRKE